MLIVYIFIGLVWLGIPTDTGMIQDGPPTMFTEQVDSVEKCQLYADSFEKAEAQLNGDTPYKISSKCILMTQTWGEKDPE